VCVGPCDSYLEKVYAYMELVAKTERKKHVERPRRK
jgi:hypothetical protein